ncbi:MAG: aromatic aminobenezylarsenical efflux permease ArsG family transporter, partial [Candidatus Peribacteraceae bacterium]|nr:aromatic aminobenezylarsenical efflux permease ArsG family transporter [Candidatus Peribacteraceae bacterium]
KDLQGKRSLVRGLLYVAGRIASYTVLAFVMAAGISAFRLSSVFQGWGELLLGPILIVVGLIMLNVLRIPQWKSRNTTSPLSRKLAESGYIGAFLLGALFALAFCPYSGALFFGALVPLMAGASSYWILPPLFAIGTGLPVVLFAVLLSISTRSAARAMGGVRTVEKYLRKIVAAVFLLSGIYFLQFTLKAFL